MQRISKNDVRYHFARYVRALESMGVDVTGYRLEEGDSVSAWRIWQPSGSGRTGAIGTGDYGFIGSTTREAYRALYHMATVLEHVRADRGIYAGVN